MAVVTTTNGTGPPVSLVIHDMALVGYLRALVARGDLVSVDVDGDTEVVVKKAAAPVSAAKGKG